MPTYDDSEPAEVHITRIDVPFFELTWFFIKANIAMALAFTATSALWVMIGAGITSLLAGLLFVSGVPDLLLPQPSVTPAVVAPPPAPEPAPEVVEPEPVAEEAAPEPVTAPVAAPVPVDPNQAATERAQREELERMRQQRGRP